MAKTFAPFGDARQKIEGKAVKSRQLYFSTYQAIAKDERRPGLYREYAPISLISSLLTSAIEAALKTSRTGETLSNTSNPHISLA